MKKKLLIFMPSIEGGGVEKNLFIISNFLAKKISKTMIITSNLNLKKKFKNQIIITPKYKFNKFDGRYKRYFFCLYELIKQILYQKRNLVVLAFQANLYCAIICKIFNVDIITRSNSSPSGWSKNFIKKILFNILLRIPKIIIVNSIKFKHEIKKNFGVNSLCIYNPLDKFDVIKKSKEKVKISFFDKEKKSLKIIFVGRLVDQKDPLTFLKSLVIIKKKINFKSLILGRGVLKKDMLNFIKKNNLMKHVKIIKFQNNPYKYIAKSDLFVLSSKFEGLPNVLLEAQALKKPIVSSNCPTGPSEILLNGKSGSLFKIGNHTELANKIIYHYNNKKISKKKINLGYKYLYRFDYNLNLNKYFQVIKKYL
mgnify:FL=1